MNKFIYNSFFIFYFLFFIFYFLFFISHVYYILIFKSITDAIIGVHYFQIIVGGFHVIIAIILGILFMFLIRIDTKLFKNSVVIFLYICYLPIITIFDLDLKVVGNYSPTLNNLLIPQFYFLLIHILWLTYRKQWNMLIPFYNSSKKTKK